MRCSFSEIHRLLELRRAGPGEREKRADSVAVFAVYNRSSKLFYGGAKPRYDVFDWLDCISEKNDTSRPGAPSKNADAMRLMMTLRALAHVVWGDLAFREAYIAANRGTLGEAGAVTQLDELRQSLALHAHSQASIAAAVAQSRVGEILCWSLESGSPVSEHRNIASLYRFVSYGGGANMHDFLETPLYRTYTHHVNEKDAIAAWVGMGDPFQFKLWQVLNNSNGVDGILTALIPHARRVKAGPSQELVNAFLNHHQIIRFNSHCAGENTAEHNFINGYLCHVGMDPAALLQKPGHFRNIKSGGDYCLIAAPGDNPENYKDCNR